LVLLAARPASSEVGDNGPTNRNAEQLNKWKNTLILLSLSNFLLCRFAFKLYNLHKFTSGLPDEFVKKIVQKVAKHFFCQT
jgi:hypothetical protein